ncbi:hypothetical protein M5K25_002610 [Dendrobium thyrsiflorum]|uniref:Peptidase A1 domain-containing protein n=1 Tax=Dendrobium thyrsiflorum TaxID=117978 RepID=A0ABD0VNR6_DENTH
MAQFYYYQFLLFLLLPLAAGENEISIPLRRAPLPLLLDPFDRLYGITSASLLRAQLLKKPTTTSPSTRAALFPHSYGGYSINISFGNPPQEIPLVFDTGSQLTWIPCTTKYICQNCSSQANSIPTFFPKASSTSKLIGCKNTKCGWIHSPEFLSRCRSCLPSNSSDCSQICPPYLLVYGSGSTAGLLLSETLHFSTLTVTDFVVGCSVFSDRMPGGGIAGFGRGVTSLPDQFRLKSFSYCLISRKFDDEGESGSLVLNGIPDSGNGEVSFTPLLKNPVPAATAADATYGAEAFSVYYYVGLRRITVGGKKVKIPHKALVPGFDGNGGTIVDSGTTFTFMEPAVFEPLAAALVGQVAGKLNRSGQVEVLTGLRPCFEMPDRESNYSFPDLVFHFKGGAEMRLPLENYFAIVGTSRPAICLTIVSPNGAAGVGGEGPAIILGSFQQQNYYVVYDLEKERLGFRRQSCS